MGFIDRQCPQVFLCSCDGHCTCLCRVLNTGHVCCMEVLPRCLHRFRHGVFHVTGSVVYREFLDRCFYLSLTNRACYAQDAVVGACVQQNDGPWEYRQIPPFFGTLSARLTIISEHFQIRSCTRWGAGGIQIRVIETER